MKLPIKPVKSATHIFQLSLAMIMFPMTKPRAPKVEPQHRKPKTVQRLHGMKHNFVMQRPPKQWMRMANHRRMRGALRACIQQRLQPPRRTFQKK